MLKSKFLSVALFVGCASVATAKNDNGNRVSSTIKEVMVYQSGAKLTSVATVSLQQGNNEIIFDNLPASVNPASLQVRIKGNQNAMLAAAKFKQRQIDVARVEEKTLKMMQDSLNNFTDKFSTLSTERDVLQNEASLIKQSVARVGNGKDASLTVKELQDMSAFYQKRLLEINTRIIEISSIERKLREPYNELSQRYTIFVQKKVKISGEIVLTINTPYTQSVEIACIYLVSNARWTPQYDLRSDGIDKPLKIIYKAAVAQTCGLDWKDVKLMLSTANPNISNNRPILSPQYIDYFVQPIAAYRQRATSNAPATQSVQLEAMQRGVATNSYNLAQVDDVNPEVEEAVFSNEPSSELTAIFEVPQTQSIATDGTEQVMMVQENEMKATYEYHTVPKLELAVFLLAKVTDYGKYNLLAGNANIFYQDTYVGQSYIDPKTVSDTLLLSLGRDESISIKRSKPTDISSERKIFGDTRKEVVEYEIIIKNNKRIAIPIEVIDQIPISRQKDIVIEVDETKLSGADYNKTYGRLLWRLNIEGNSNRKLRFGYTLKYPKDKQVKIK